MAILQGQAAQDYINQNPNSGYDILDQNNNIVQHQTPDAGFLGNIVNGIANNLVNKPFQFGYDILGGKLSGNQNYQPQFLTQNEYNNPVSTGLQTAAGVASMAPLPGLTGLGGALLQGGLSGGLGSFANQNLSNGLDVGNLAASAGLGALAGGVLHGVGGFIGNKLSQSATTAAEASETPRLFTNITPSTETDLTNQLANPQPLSEMNPLQRMGKVMQYEAKGFQYPKGALDFVNARDTDISRIDSALNTFGLPKTASGISQLSTEVGNLRENVVTATPLNYNLRDIISEQAPLMAKNQGITVPQAEEYLIDAAKKQVEFPQGLSLDQTLHGEVPINQNDLFGLKQQFADSSSKFYENSGNVKPQFEAEARLHDFANNELKQNIPGYKDLNDLYQSLIRQNPSTVSSANAQAGIPNPFSRRSIFGKLESAIQNTVGKGVEKIGNIQAGQAGGQVAKAVNPLIAPIISAVASGQASGQSKQNAISPDEIIGQNGESLTNNQSTGNTQMANVFKNPKVMAFLQAAAMARKDPMQSLQQVGQMMQMTGQGNPFYRPTAAEAQQSMQAKNALNSLSSLAQLIQQNPGQVGPIGGGIGGSIMGLTNPVAREQITKGLAEVPGMISSYTGTKNPTNELSMLMSSPDLLNKINGAMQQIQNAEAMRQYSQINPYASYTNFIQ